MDSAPCRIALVTCRPQPQINADRSLPVLVAAVAAAGAEASAVCWDDSDVDWAEFDLVVIRSTWDYLTRTAEFVAWAERCARHTVLANPAEVVRWNTDKRYLGDLAAAGVPVVPTRYLPPGAGADRLPASGEYVIKPTVGAGARYVGRYRAGDRASETAARAHLDRMHAEGLTAMVQPYARNIDVTGERALVFFGGHLIHAVRKGAVLTADAAFHERKNAHPDRVPWRATAAEIAAARQALAAVPGAARLLYARVDLVDGDDGRLQLMELELVEPNLFLELHPASVSAVAAHIVAAADAARAAARTA